MRAAFDREATGQWEQILQQQERTDEKWEQTHGKLIKERRENKESWERDEKSTRNKYASKMPEFLGPNGHENYLIGGIWRVLAKNPEGYPLMRTPKPNVDRPTANHHAKRPLVSRVEPRGKANDTPSNLLWQGRKRGPPVPGPTDIATLSQRGWTQKEEPHSPQKPAVPRPPLSARGGSSMASRQGRLTPRRRARAVLAKGEAQMSRVNRGSVTSRDQTRAQYDCSSRASTHLSGAFSSRGSPSRIPPTPSRINTPSRRERELQKLKRKVLGSLEETEKSLRIEELYRMRDQVLGTLGEIDVELGDD